jgi:hypothetical protein
VGHKVVSRNACPDEPELKYLIHQAHEGTLRFFFVIFVPFVVEKPACSIMAATCHVNLLWRQTCNIEPLDGPAGR